MNAATIAAEEQPMTERQHTDDAHTLSRRMVAAITNFETATADLIALLLEAAASQSATAVLSFADNAAASTDRVIGRLDALAARVDALERREQESSRP